jgi:virulence-associated protein VapD
MFGIAFDLDTAAARQHHPSGTSSKAYSDIRITLAEFGFERIQGSTYAAQHEDHGKLFLALTALRELGWLGECLHDVRVFRLEQGTDFTPIISGRYSAET